MCNTPNLTQIFIANSSYSLYMYLLMFTDKIDKTLFVTGPALKEAALPNHINISELNASNQRSVRNELHSVLKERLKGAVVPVYGNVTFGPTKSLAASYPLYPISDGLSDENRFPKYLKSNRYQTCCTTKNNGVRGTHEKLEYVDLDALWQEKKPAEQAKIAGIFGVTEQDLTLFKSRGTVLVTQPLSEDGIMSESDKVELYSRILKDYDLNDVIIKPHPREKTNWRALFADAKIPVPSRLVPAELFGAMTPIQKAVTFFSTAAFNMARDVDIYATDFKHLHCAYPHQKMGAVSYVDIEEKYRAGSSFHWKKVNDEEGRFYRLPLVIVSQEHPALAKLRLTAFNSRQNG